MEKNWKSWKFEILKSESFLKVEIRRTFLPLGINIITMNNVPLKVDFLKAEISRTFLPLEINLITMKNVPIIFDFFLNLGK